MGIWGVTLALAILAVVVTGGSFFQLARIRIQAPWLLFLAVAIQIPLGFIDLPQARLDDLGFGLLMAGYALLLAFCFVNLGPVRGMGVITIGIAMNLLVIGLNQGMPTTEKMWQDGKVVEEPFQDTVKHQPESDTDLLPFLGDTMPLPPPFSEVISFGDLVLAFGVINVCFWGSRKRRRKAADDLEPVAIDAIVIDEPEIDLTGEHEPVPVGDAWPVAASKPAIQWSAPEPVAANGSGVDVDTAVVDLNHSESNGQRIGAGAPVRREGTEG